MEQWNFIRVGLPQVMPLEDESGSVRTVLTLALAFSVRNLVLYTTVNVAYLK